MERVQVQAAQLLSGREFANSGALAGSRSDGGYPRPPRVVEAKPAGLEELEASPY